MLAETGFAARTPLWGGIGVTVKDALTSREALEKSGLDWEVQQKEIFLEDGSRIPGSYANVRSSDNKPLGIVGERYHIVQNTDAFEFTDALIGEGVRYETAGSLKGGKQIWLLAKLPQNYKMLGDIVEPFVCFTNSHDGSGSVKIATTGVRVICQNTLNLALRKAKRTWSARHTRTVTSKIAQARETLKLADAYMKNLNDTFEELYKIKLNKDAVVSLVDELVPIEDGASPRKETTAKELRSDIIYRYEDAPDLKEREETGARFIQAVLDTASHKEPARLTENWQENRFFKMANIQNELADRAMNLVMAAA